MTTSEPAIAVRPLRFTDDLSQMRTFYERLGLHPRIEGSQGGWLDMVGAAGMVALHDAATSDSGGAAGETRLSFEVADAYALCRRLHDAGFDSATVWDEAYGRVLSVTDPFGARIWADERSDDDYGFRRHTDPGASPVQPVPVRRAPDVDAYCLFLALFDLGTRLREHDRSVVAGDGGAVAVHQAGEVASTAAIVETHFETSEPLQELVARLRDAEFTDAMLRDGAVRVTDPDGCCISVRSGAEATR